MRECAGARAGALSYLLPLERFPRTVPRKGRPAGAPRAPKNRDFTPQNQYGSVEKFFCPFFGGRVCSSACAGARVRGPGRFLPPWFPRKRPRKVGAPKGRPARPKIGTSHPKTSTAAWEKFFCPFLRGFPRTVPRKGRFFTPSPRVPRKRGAPLLQTLLETMVLFQQPGFPRKMRWGH